MDPLSILSSIYTAATELHAIYSQVKANKKQCATLNERVQAIIPHVRLLETRLREKFNQRVANGQLDSLEAADEVALRVQLQRLANTLEAAVALVTKFNKKNWIGRLVNKADYSRDFADLNADLSTLSGDLHLGVSVSAVFDAAKDAADAQADLQQLLAGQEEILEGQANLSARQEDIQSGVSGLHLLVQAQKDEADARMHSRRQFRAEITAGLALAQQQLAAALSAAAANLNNNNNNGGGSSSSSSSCSPSSTRSSTRPAAHVVSIELDDLTLDAEPVGCGGFGDVYRAEWKSRDLIVAVKKLRVSALSRHALAEFEGEVRLMANVPRHDHVIGLLGVCLDQSTHTYILVMDWMGRGSLYQLMRDQSISGATPLSLHDRLSLMLQCAKALNHLHLLRPPAGPIIHGDVKSMNYLINRHGDVKIGDFGLAKIRHESMSQSKLSQLTATGGSVQYTAPELLDGFDEATTASDVYSLAIVLWEVLTGKVPYAGVTPERITQLVPQGKRLTIPADANEKVRSIIEQAWHQDLKQRPTCQQLVQAIKMLMQEVHVPSVASVVLSPSASPSSPRSASSPVEQSVSSPPVQQAEEWLNLTVKFELPSWFDSSVYGDSFHIHEGITAKQFDELAPLISALATIPTKLQSLTILDLDQGRLRAITLPRLCSMLRADCAIVQLDLTRCALDNAGVELLFDALSNNTRLQVLKLRSATTFVAARMLQTNSTLTEVSFVGPLHDASWIALAEAVHVNRTLRAVFLRVAAQPRVKSLEALKAALDENDILCVLDIQWLSTWTSVLDELHQDYPDNDASPDSLVLRYLRRPLTTEEEIWQMSDSDYTKYLTQLIAAGDVVAEPNAFLRRFGAGLSDAQLRSVWLLADIRGNGRLNQYELTLTLHLITGVRDHHRPLPQLLPDVLVLARPSSTYPPGAPWLDLTVKYELPGWLGEFQIMRPLLGVELEHLERVFSSPIPGRDPFLTIHPEAYSPGSALMLRLCSMLRANCAITWRLNLSHCKLSDSDLASLLQSLEHNTQLKELSALVLVSSAIPALVAMLRTNRKLKVLSSLDVSQISNADFAALAEAILSNPVLRQLDLRMDVYNKDPSDESLAAFKSALAERPTPITMTLRGDSLFSIAGIDNPPSPPEDETWQMADLDRVKYIAQFKSEELDKKGCLSGEAANAFLRRVGAGLTDAQLRSVWVLASDIQNYYWDKLNEHEYSVACHLIAGVRDHQRPLPLVLPEFLRWR